MWPIFAAKIDLTTADHDLLLVNSGISKREFFGTFYRSILSNMSSDMCEKTNLFRRVYNARKNSHDFSDVINPL